MAIIVPAVAGKIIHIGRAGENLATTVTFNVSEWLDIFGNEGTFSLFVQQGGASYYPQVLPDDGAVSGLVDNNVIWAVTDSNTATVGLGKCELAYAINGVIVKSIIYDFVVTNSLDIEAAGNVPRPIDSWLNEVSQMTDQIVHAADYANEAERWAKGTENGEPVSSGDGYQDNSKYYSQQAETQKQLAARWADSNNNPSGTPTATNNARYFSDEAEQWAKGQINGVDVPSSHAGYHDNSKYFSEQSERWARGKVNGQDVPSGQAGYQDNSKYYSLRAERWAKGTENGTPVSSGDGYNNNAKYYAERIQSLEAAPVVTGEPGTNASANVSLNTSNNTLTLNLTIPRGDQGYGIKIIGVKTSQSQLPSASSVEAGTAYGVGTQIPYDIYISTGSNWVNYGPIGGTVVTLYDWTSNS